jgi:hypothetical protein
MATPTTSLQVSQASQKQILKYSESLFSAINYNFSFRGKLLEQDRIYYRELDWTDAKRRADVANLTGDASKISNVVVPVVGPQVDSARAFFTEMFLSSYPIFPVVTAPDQVDAGLQLETILGQSAIFYQWGRHLSMAFNDGLKYNIQAMEVDWCTEKVPSIVTDTAKSVSKGSVQEIEFQGNKLYRINPYNLIFDHRVPISEIHTRGEFAGYSDLITRIELKKLLLGLDRSMTMNATEAFQSGQIGATTEINQQGSFYIPQINPKMFLDPKFAQQNWLQWANLDTKNKIRYSDMYEKTVLYCRIIPAEFGMYRRYGDLTPGIPQIYKFIIINRKVVVYVQRLTNAHGFLPIIIGQMNEDGLGLQTKSYADNAAPYQFLASALYNSGLQSQRRKVYDRIIYDPSRINKSDIDKADPVARIPVKTEAYGKPVTDALFVAPYRDEGVATILSMAREVVDMADVSTGSNRVQRGQFQKGNKTRYEVENVMGNSDSRPKMSAVLLGIGWLGPIKDILKYNILQYQPPANLFNQDKKQKVTIDPVKLREIAWSFQLADGIMPADKFLNFDLFGQALQYAGIDPAVGAEWDLLGMFAYQLKAQGARWVDNFRRTPEQQKQFIQNSRQAQMPLQPEEPGGPPALPQPAAPAPMTATR